jgi:FKBP-type peptidyl-prolyl cis-trans isomerase
MKRLAIIACCLTILLPLAAQDQKPAAPETPAAPAAPADPSYALGMLLGANIKSNGLADIVLDDFMAGFKAGISGGETKMSQAEAQSAVQAALGAAKEKKSAANLAAGKAFLAENGKKAGVTVTASGLQYEVITAGTGAKPSASDTVKVNYEGKLIDGKVFDSSYQRGEPATFPLSNIIPGWTEGLQLMQVGSKYRFYLPPELAYGEQGAGDTIEPNSVLVFDIELLSIETPAAPTPAPADAPATAPAAAPKN